MAFGALRMGFVSVGSREFRREFTFWERVASCLTNSENLSAPVAIDARAMPVVLAATLPKAAASFNPDENAARARSSAALIDSLDAEMSPLFGKRAFGLAAFPIRAFRAFLCAKRRS